MQARASVVRDPLVLSRRGRVELVQARHERAAHTAQLLAQRAAASLADAGAVGVVIVRGLERP